MVWYDFLLKMFGREHHDLSADKLEPGHSRDPNLLEAGRELSGKALTDKIDALGKEPLNEWNSKVLAPLNKASYGNPYTNRPKKEIIFLLKERRLWQGAWEDVILALQDYERDHCDKVIEDAELKLETARLKRVIQQYQFLLELKEHISSLISCIEDDIIPLGFNEGLIDSYDFYHREGSHYRDPNCSRTAKNLGASKRAYQTIKKLELDFKKIHGALKELYR